MKKSVFLRVTGKVQGVYFRKSGLDTATSLALTGWIRNVDNHVEIFISGELSSVNKFIEWAGKGPERARVDSVEIAEKPFTDFPDFKIVR